MMKFPLTVVNLESLSPPKPTPKHGEKLGDYTARLIQDDVGRLVGAPIDRPTLIALKAILMAAVDQLKYVGYISRDDACHMDPRVWINEERHASMTLNPALMDMCFDIRSQRFGKHFAL